MRSTSFGCFLVINIILIDALPTFNTQDDSTINNRPIIGILTQEVTWLIPQQYHSTHDSYIAASYVKYLESAGARVVPIWIDREESYYEDILSKINGVLFPGGDADFNNTHGYADAGEIIYRIATRYNENGNYFPLWGTCLGFELMTYLAANRFEHRIPCSSRGQALPLQFTADYKNSRLFKNAPADIVDILKTENVTGNYHRFCVTKESLIKANLTNQIHVLSVNDDSNHVRFISSLEHFKLPFYAVQFHPEKNNFEWALGKNIPHSYNAVRVCNFFADFFVNEARKNHQKFLSTQDENEALIYNYNPKFTANSSFAQIYMFKSNKTLDQTTNYTVTLLMKNTLRNP